MSGFEGDFIPKGLEIIKSAVIADNEDRLEQAFSLYKQGLEYFMTGLKYMKNEKSKLAIRQKMVQYMDRAEKIKHAIEQRNKPEEKKVVKPGAGDDDDKAKFQEALSSAILSEKPNVRWDDVAGLNEAKKLLYEAVILPVQHPELFEGNRKPWKGILLYGPPGTGKSYLAKAVATESGASCFFSISSADLMSKYQGESERLVKNLFEMARAKAPSIVFIDEIDSLVSARDSGGSSQGSSERVKTEFLIQMDGVGKDQTGVLVLGATNLPWSLDQAMRRRFEKRVYIPLPEPPAREILFKVSIGATPNSLKPENFKSLAARTEGLSGADISIMVRDALMEPVRTCQIATHFKKVPCPAENTHGQFPFLLSC